ncbi:MAG: MBL fold metallo-hydrolase [Acidobacteriota bacterium]
MKLTVLGSGTGQPHATRGSSGYWVETNSGTLMLDCSASSLRRMAEYKLDWPNLDAIWISHFHLDHVGGVAPFLAATKHAEETKGRTKPLRIFGPTGTRNLLNAFNDANDYRLFKQLFPIEIEEIEELEKFEMLPGLEAVALSTPHTPESHAIHLRENDKVLVYTSDTGFTKTLGAFGKDADLFVAECSYLQDKPVEKHLELAEAIHIVRRADPKRAMLTHFYPDWDSVDFEKEVAKFSTGIEIIEANDGLQLSL